MTFAQAAQMAKDARGWSVRDLAKQAGVPSATVHRCVTGHDTMLSSALKIAAVLGLDTGDLGQPGDLK